MSDAKPSEQALKRAQEIYAVWEQDQIRKTRQTYHESFDDDDLISMYAAALDASKPVQVSDEEIEAAVSESEIVAFGNEPCMPGDDQEQASYYRRQGACWARARWMQSKLGGRDETR